METMDFYGSLPPPHTMFEDEEEEAVGNVGELHPMVGSLVVDDLLNSAACPLSPPSDELDEMLSSFLNSEETETDCEPSTPPAPLELDVILQDFPLTKTEPPNSPPASAASFVQQQQQPHQLQMQQLWSPTAVPQHGLVNLPPFCSTIPVVPLNACKQFVGTVAPIAVDKKPVMPVQRGQKRMRTPSAVAPRISSDKLLSMANGSMAVADHLSAEDERELKKQRRMIKNRESAQKSRQRRKDQMDELELMVAKLKETNTKLTQRNKFLEEKIKQLEHTISVLKGTATAVAATVKSTVNTPNRSVQAAGVCLLVVLFSFGLFFNAANNGLTGGPLAGPVEFTFANLGLARTLKFIAGHTGPTPVANSLRLGSGHLEEVFPKIREAPKELLSTLPHTNDTQQRLVDGQNTTTLTVPSEETAATSTTPEKVGEASASASQPIPTTPTRSSKGAHDDAASVIKKQKKASGNWTKTPLWVKSRHSPAAATPLAPNAPTATTVPPHISPIVARTTQPAESLALVTREEATVPGTTAGSRTYLYCGDVREVVIPGDEPILGAPADQHMSLLIPFKAFSAAATENGAEMGMLSRHLHSLFDAQQHGDLEDDDDDTTTRRPRHNNDNMMPSLAASTLVEVSCQLTGVHVYSPPEPSAGPAGALHHGEPTADSIGNTHNATTVVAAA